MVAKDNKDIKKIKRKELHRKLLKVSQGLIGTMTDFFLFHLHILNAMPGKGSSSRAVYQSIREAHSELENINYQTIQNTLGYLKRKGFARLMKEPKITFMGKRRLKSTLPVYQKERPWDNCIYLVTYDIPENEREIRNQLRNLLRTIGAGLLQRSVWLTPYNPEQILKDFYSESSQVGEIVVSCIGKDGYIGRKNIKELIKEVYNLVDINYQYEFFIEEFNKYKQFSNKSGRWDAAVSYLAILQEDPQLPWDLLPKDWVGDKAYLLYRKIVKSS